MAARHAIACRRHTNMEKNRIDELYAAWMLTEILHEKKLINDATIEAIRQKVAEERSKKKSAA